MEFSTFIFVLEMIGTVAFAVSGVMVAKERGMDIFGACVLGCSTAVGGGVIRDLLLGKTPPDMFVEPIYVIVATAASLITFVAEYVFGRKGSFLDRTRLRTGRILNAADSVGLAAFVVVGCRQAVVAGYGDNLFLCAFVGVMTGIGGGILRDMLAGQMPLIMRKRIYGMAAIAGAVVYCLCISGLMSGGSMENMPAGIASMLVTVLIRFLAIHYGWNLPSFQKEGEGQDHV